MRRAMMGVALLAMVVSAGCAKQRACAAGQEPTAQRLPRTVAGFHPYTHAHNDYEHDHPLFDALANRIYSVEADIWWDGGNFKISHEGIFSKGNLKGLYLDPIAQQVNDHGGSVYGDGLTFYLWIDIKDENDALPDALSGLLDQYPDIFTLYTDDSVTQKPVTVILTGDDKMKRATVQRPARRMIRDSNDYTPEDPPADNKWRAYALDWTDFFDFDGHAPVSAKDDRAMSCIIANAHRAGRVVRIYDGPDTPESWGWQLDHGVDFINADDLVRLNAFLDRQ